MKLPLSAAMTFVELGLSLELVLVASVSGDAPRSGLPAASSRCARIAPGPVDGATGQTKTKLPSLSSATLGLNSPSTLLESVTPFVPHRNAPVCETRYAWTSRSGPARKSVNTQTRLPPESAIRPQS